MREITSEMKAACLGEFSIVIPEYCYCGGANIDCALCHGDGEYKRTVHVPWTTCKEIFKRMDELAGA